MITAYGVYTASWFEMAWTIAALIGFIPWFQSYLSARKSLRAARSLGVGNGRLLWAKFSVQLTLAMLFIESVFIIIGVFAMLSRGSDPPSVYSFVIASCLILASVMITVLAFSWRSVEDQILLSVRKQRLESDTLAKRKSSLDDREMAQNTRDTDQNLRESQIDSRDGRQSKS